MKWSAPWKSSLPGKIDRNIAYTFAAIQDRRLQGAVNFDIIAIRLLLWLFLFRIRLYQAMKQSEESEEADQWRDFKIGYGARRGTCVRFGEKELL